MTVQEAITRINNDKPNQVPDERKAKWLNDLDKSVQEKILTTHKGKPVPIIESYEPGSDREMLIPSPYEDVYIFWLESRIDQFYGDTKKFNNSYALYDTLYEEFAKQYHRTNMPLGGKFVF